MPDPLDPGGKTVLQNTLIVVMAECLPVGHGSSGVPALLLGTAGGKIKPGLVNGSGVTNKNIMATVLSAFDVGPAHFGSTLISEIRFEEARRQNATPRTRQSRHRRLLAISLALGLAGLGCTGAVDGGGDGPGGSNNPGNSVNPGDGKPGSRTGVEFPGPHGRLEQPGCQPGQHAGRQPGQHARWADRDAAAGPLGAGRLPRRRQGHRSAAASCAG